MSYLTERPIAQGELDFWLVSEDHFSVTGAAMPDDGEASYILAHSEQGHHHVLDRAKADVTVIRPESEGFRILRALVKEPVSVVNLNPTGHTNLPLSPGVYEIRTRRELGMDDMVRRSQD